jgi:hypothetical protein
MRGAHRPDRAAEVALFQRRQRGGRVQPSPACREVGVTAAMAVARFSRGATSSNAPVHTASSARRSHGSATDRLPIGA